MPRQADFQVPDEKIDEISTHLVHNRHKYLYSASASINDIPRYSIASSNSLSHYSLSIMHVLCSDTFLSPEISLRLLDKIDGLVKKDHGDEYDVAYLGLFSDSCLNYTEHSVLMMACLN